MKGGALLPTPFLDLTGLVTSGGERGLLGLAFHPDYTANGRFYVSYTGAGGTACSLASSSLIVEGNSRRTIFLDFAPSLGGELTIGPNHLFVVALNSDGIPDTTAFSVFLVCP